MAENKLKEFRAAITLCAMYLFLKVINKVVWHKKGDYFAVVMPEAPQVIIHQLSRQKSQVSGVKIIALLSLSVSHVLN